MMIRRRSMSLPLAAAAVTLGGLAATALAGPDVIVGDLPDIIRYGASNGVTAYAVGTTSCNTGTTNVQWIDSTNRHPVIGGTMYRLKGNRFEQIGQSWLKHGFYALSDTLCGSCPRPTDGTSLGVGCSDTYTASLNGSQFDAGPRSQVNATTGVFPYPFTPPTDPLGTASGNGTITRRLQVSTADIDPTQNAGAQYLVEGQYVTQDDAQAGLGVNNCSYRKIRILSATGTPSFLGATQRTRSAVVGWKDIDPGVVVTNFDYTDAMGITARFAVGSRATDNGNGTWHYEYAVQNINSDRSAGSFIVPVPTGVAVSNMGFHAPKSHSGEPYSNADWDKTMAAGNTATFSTAAYATSVNANAIRWGTTYTLRFDADAAPALATGTATVGLFKPGAAGSPASVSGAVVVPGVPCPSDVDRSGETDANDLSAYLNLWSADLAHGTSTADFDHSGETNANDISAFINAWYATLIAGSC